MKQSNKTEDGKECQTNNLKENFFGCAKGLFKIPEDFDDIDISDYFEEDI